jgi:hypothetical protein
MCWIVFLIVIGLENKLVIARSEEVMGKEEVGIAAKGYHEGSL